MNPTSQPRSAPERPTGRGSGRRVVAGAVLALGIAIAGGPAAAASQGSVPAEVVAYAEDPDGLLARLDDLFGVDAGGDGIEFDETAAVGQLNRVFVFTPAFLAGEATETPVERANEWTAPIELRDEPLGLATIWINQSTVDPELADFVGDPELATALADVPADAYLVRDSHHDAWFTLVGEDLAPLVPGSTGLDAPTTLAAYQRWLADEQATTEPAQRSQVSALAITVIVVSALVIIAVIVLPLVRDLARKRRVGPDGEPEPEAEGEPEPEPGAGAGAGAGGATGARGRNLAGADEETQETLRVAPPEGAPALVVRLRGRPRSPSLA